LVMGTRQRGHCIGAMEYKVSDDGPAARWLVSSAARRALRRPRRAHTRPAPGGLALGGRRRARAAHGSGRPGRRDLAGTRAGCGLAQGPAPDARRHTEAPLRRRRRVRATPHGLHGGTAGLDQHFRPARGPATGDALAGAGDGLAVAPQGCRSHRRPRPAAALPRNRSALPRPRFEIMKEPVILSAVRLPTGKFLGALKTFTAPQLGALVVREAVARAGVSPEQVDEVILGNVVSAGLGQAPARQAAIRAGLPPQVGALTINKVCGSGLKAVMLAAQAVQTDNAEIVVAGGMESMSNCPYLLTRVREGMRLGHGEAIDSMIWDGLWDAYEDYHMGCTGEVVAEKYSVTREEQDAWALESHRRAIDAIRAGRFVDEILPVPIAQKKGDPLPFAVDESPREDTSHEALALLKPAFKAGGTVTAGNAPGVNDGAAALVVTSQETAAALGRK